MTVMLFDLEALAFGSRKLNNMNVKLSDTSDTSSSESGNSSSDSDSDSSSSGEEEEQTREAEKKAPEEPDPGTGTQQENQWSLEKWMSKAKPDPLLPSVENIKTETDEEIGGMCNDMMLPNLSPIKELDNFNTFKKSLDLSVHNSPPPSIENIGRTTEHKSKCRVPSPAVPGRSPGGQAGKSPRSRPANTTPRHHSEGKGKARPHDETPVVASSQKASPRAQPRKSGKSPGRGKTPPRPRAAPGNTTPRSRKGQKYTSKEIISSSEDSSSEDEPVAVVTKPPVEVEVDVDGVSSPEKDATPKSHKPSSSSKRPEQPAKRRGRPPKAPGSGGRGREERKSPGRGKARRSLDNSGQFEDVMSVLESVSRERILSPIPSLDTHPVSPTPSTVVTMATSTSTLATSAATISVSSGSAAPSVKYVDGRPSIMVHLDLALIGLSSQQQSVTSGHVSLGGHVPSNSLEGSSNSSSGRGRKGKGTMAPPALVRSMVSVEEGEICDEPDTLKPEVDSISSSVMDTGESQEDAASERSLDLHPPRLPEPADISAPGGGSSGISDSSSSKNAKKSSSEKKNEQDHILKDILPNSRLKPDLKKIPLKRKKDDTSVEESSSGTTSSKKPRVSDKGSSKVKSSSKRPHDCKSESRTTPKHTAIDITDREVTSHEDDHRWDRKHQRTAGQFPPPGGVGPGGEGVEEDRLSTTSNTSSQHSEPPSRPLHRAPLGKDWDRRGRNHGNHGVKGHDTDGSRDYRSSKGYSNSHDWDAPESRCNGTSESTGESPAYNGHSQPGERGGHSAGNQWQSLLTDPKPEPFPSRRHGDDTHNGRRPSRRKVAQIDDRLKAADFYLNEARRLKHNADQQPDKFSKSLMYMESVLSFIQYGNAMEAEHFDSRKIFRVYEDTFKLVKHICNNGTSSRNSQHPSDMQDKERKLTVLSLRLQAILNYKLFRIKKGDAGKLKKVLDDHYAKAAAKPLQSPYSGGGTTWSSRTTGTPSPMSPQPSPGGSVGSVGSQGSNGDQHLPRMMNGGSGGGGSSVTVPQRIHSITQDYLSYMAYLYQAQDSWDSADNIAGEKNCQEFFKELDVDCGRLAFQSTVPEIVRFIKEGLHRLKDT